MTRPYSRRWWFSLILAGILAQVAYGLVRLGVYLWQMIFPGGDYWQTVVLGLVWALGWTLFVYLRGDDDGE